MSRLHRRTMVALSLTAMLIAATPLQAAATAGQLPPELRAVRAAVAKYHSLDEALAAGYSAAGQVCVASPAGAMGIHATNAALIRSGAMDSLRPQILLYTPRSDGSMKLVGVEYFKVDADQNLATDADRPFLFGRGFDGPMPGHSPSMPIHYDLHVWVAESNPDGVFAMFNPDLRCG